MFKNVLQMLKEFEGHALQIICNADMPSHVFEQLLVQALQDVGQIKLAQAVQAAEKVIDPSAPEVPPVASQEPAQ
jgi:hypothetical protein